MTLALPEGFHKATERQLEFASCKAPEVMFSGSVSSGKTFALWLKALMHASHPGACVGMCRKTLASFKASSLKSLIEGDANCPPILTPGTYKHDERNGKIRLSNGSTIEYFSMEEPERIRGRTFSACGVDEASDLTEEEWQLLKTRVRVKIKDEPLQLFGACNPKSQDHWIAKRFGIRGNLWFFDQALLVNGYPCRAICTTMAENPFLSNEYIRGVASALSGAQLERDVYGKWVSAQGLVFSSFDSSTHVVDVVPHCVRKALCLDVGYTAPTVCLEVGITEDNRLSVVNEWRKTNAQANHILQNVGRLAEPGRELPFDADIIIVDSARPDLIQDLKDAGYPAMPANKINTKALGIHKLRHRFTVKSELGPALTIHRRCQGLINELSSLEYVEGTETPQNGHDDACDALRYLVFHLDCLNGNYVPVRGQIHNVMQVERTKPILVRKETRGPSESERVWADKTFSRLN